MVQTRGRNSAKVISVQFGSCNPAKLQFDIQSHLDNWKTTKKHKVKKPPVEMLECLRKTLVCQSAAFAAPLLFCEGETKRQIKNVEKAAANLLAKLNDLKNSNLHGLVLQKLEELQFPITDMSVGDLATSDASYIFTDKLDKLANFTEHLEEIDPKHLNHNIIIKVYEVFEAYGHPATVSKSSNFVSFLCRVENDNPGYVFPEQTVPQGRFDYICKCVREYKKLLRENSSQK